MRFSVRASTPLRPVAFARLSSGTHAYWVFSPEHSGPCFLGDVCATRFGCDHDLPYDGAYLGGFDVRDLACR
jgi:hypothetical protein